MDYLKPFCNTEKQLQYLNAYLEHGTERKAAKALGIARSSINDVLLRIKKQASVKGLAPEHDLTHQVPDTFNVKGVSTLYGEDGSVKAQWIKTDRNKDALQEIMLEAVKALKSDIKPEKPVRQQGKTEEPLINVYVITDYHFGMYADRDETGGDWDTQIAEDLLVNWFNRAISLAPASKTAVLAQLGDFLHYDSLEAITPSSGHLLDADTRFQKVVRVVIRALRRVVRLLLRKHETVHLIMAEGNHDLASSVWLREMLSALYANEPRVKVDDSIDPYYCIEHGKVSLFFHHGHKRKPAQVSSVFAAKYREVFGRTQHSYAHLGHLHSDEVKEDNLMKIEQHRTLAAPDAYSSRGGWVSGRDAKVITYHKDYGEVSRLTISPEMVG